MMNVTEYQKHIKASMKWHIFGMLLAAFMSAFNVVILYGLVRDGLTDKFVYLLYGALIAFWTWLFLRHRRDYLTYKKRLLDV